jgi:hypothetical protein
LDSRELQAGTVLEHHTRSIKGMEDATLSFALFNPQTDMVAMPVR